jgi:hypothetical protein
MGKGVAGMGKGVPMLDLITLWSFMRPSMYTGTGAGNISAGIGAGIWVDDHIIISYGTMDGNGHGDGDSNGEGDGGPHYG